MGAALGQGGSQAGACAFSAPVDAAPCTAIEPCDKPGEVRGVGAARGLRPLVVVMRAA